MYGRNIRTRVNIKKPDSTTTVINGHYGTTAKLREFSSSDDVNTRDYRFNSEKRANGRKHSQTGPLSYNVDINGTLWRRHVDQIVGTSENQPRNRTHTVTSNVTYDIQYMPFSCTSDTVSE